MMTFYTYPQPTPASVAQFEPIRHEQTLVDFVCLEVECDIPESPRREGRSPTVEQGYLNSWTMPSRTAAFGSGPYALWFLVIRRDVFGIGEGEGSSFIPPLTFSILASG